MTRLRIASVRDERGSALPMVLVFIVVIGALVAALLSQASTNFRTARVADEHQRKVYAANNALEVAIQKLRADPTLCSGQGTTGEVDDTFEVNDRTVHISCTGLDGGSTGAGGWAIYTTGTGTTLTIRCDPVFFGLIPCQSSPKRIVGSVYSNGGWNVNQEVTIQDGFVQQGPAAACNQPTTLRFSPYVQDRSPSRYRCGAAPLPAPPWSLAELTGGVKPPPAPAPTNHLGCRVWSPGTYTSMDLGSGWFTSEHYLRSGVYVLDGATLSIPIGTRLVGGRPNNGSTAQVGLSGDCLAAQNADTQNGVVIILVGNARIDTLLGSFELNPYRPPGGDPSRPPISIYQVSAEEAAAWGSSTSAPTNALEVDDFSFFNLSISEALNAKLSLHGAVYTPRSGVSVGVYPTVPYPIGGGVVARSFRLELGPFSGGTGGASEFGVSGGLPSQNRTVDVTVTVLPSAPGAEKPILGHARLVISNDRDRSVSVESWRIDEDTSVDTPVP